MTDITELALIAKIKKQTENFDTVVLKEWEALALVEALEKAQQLATQQGNIACALFDEVTAQRQRIAELESQLKAAENNEIDARCHIADLESRTVKLPPKVDSSNIPFAGHTWNCCLDEVEKRLAAAGIKVEAQ
ncbi:hypothetical protein [Klebsiella quasipneumoniae]|uniref:hypothetical protein n=1 Tax=Klebsiella quasipneumoniae TaxID=1463165 RepID=UPI003D31B1CF